MQLSGKYQETIELPLIGTNYRWKDLKKGVAGTDVKDVETDNDRSPRINHGMWFKDKPTQIRWYTDPTFAGGANKYRYERINNIANINDAISKSEWLVRSSYIPYIVIDGTKYWLLGSFFDFPEIKVDFGGKCERGEGPIPCASRELQEETRGVLNEPVRRALADGRGTIYKGYNLARSDKNRNKRVIFIMVDMTDYLEDLDEIQKEIEQSERITNEKFGPLDFYREPDVLRGMDTRKNNNRIYTSLALTDFTKSFRSLQKGPRDRNQRGRW